MQATQQIIIPAIAENGSLYPVEKLEAHERALFHLAVSVFLFSGDKLLIQQRALSKYHCGGLWANTCCTHPHWNENLQDCAHRRMGEELGIYGLSLDERRTEEYSASVGNGLHEHERVTMYTADITLDEFQYNLNPDEVAAIRWVTLNELREEIQKTPEQFTPWFRIYLERFPEMNF